MSTVPSTEKQGYLGNLENKPTSELIDLLKRQNSIVANKSFVGRLPDKGKKLEAFVKKLQDILNEREKRVDETAQLFEKLALNSGNSRDLRRIDNCKEVESLNSAQLNDSCEEDEPDPLRQIVNREMPDKMLSDNRPEEKNYINSYEKVIRKTEEIRVQGNKNKFMPYRSLNQEDIQKTVERLKTTDVSSTANTVMDKVKCQSCCHATNQNQHQSMDISSTKSPLIEGSSKKVTECDENMTDDVTCKDGHSPGGSSVYQCRCRHLHKYDDSLECAAYSGKLQNEPAKLINIEESFRLQQDQKSRFHELQAQKAAERLAQQLNIKMTSFEPEGTNVITYREKHDEAEDEDADLDAEETDYPD